MTTEQRSVAGGMALAVICTVVVLGVWYGMSRNGMIVAHLSGPVASALISLSLLYSIATIARKRFFNSSVIQGAAYDTPGSSVAIDKAILQNTLEQVVLAALVYMALSVASPGISDILLAPLVTLFLIGRLLFILGYAKGAGSRALGFGLTFYPTVFAYLTFIYLLIFM